MKSYLLLTGDFVKTGGMDRANFALADYLARQGNQIHLVAYRVATDLLNYPNVIFHRVPKFLNSYLLSSPLLDRSGRYLAKLLGVDRTRVLVNGGNCQWGDINWVHYVHAAYKPEIRSGLLGKLKAKMTYQSTLAAEKKALNLANVIIVNSERTKLDIISRLDIKPERIQTVYYGIDPSIFYPASAQERVQLRQKLGWPQDKPIAVFIGALGDRRKGFDTLFTAWQQLCADPNWDTDLVAIGRGAELPLWQQRTAQAGLESRIQFLGFRSDVPDILRAADCLVAPTRYEAYGLGVHEALCCGLPAIVSADAGVAERYPETLQDLLMSNPDDVEDLVLKFKKWRSHQDDYKKLVFSLSQELTSYTWDDMAKNILAAIETTSLANH
jgi:glycosyltransferase involved in cell wall biosynthesis